MKLTSIASRIELATRQHVSPNEALSQQAFADRVFLVGEFQKLQPFMEFEDAMKQARLKTINKILLEANDEFPRLCNE